MGEPRNSYNAFNLEENVEKSLNCGFDLSIWLESQKHPNLAEKERRKAMNHPTQLIIRFRSKGKKLIIRVGEVMTGGQRARQDFSTDWCRRIWSKRECRCGSSVL